MSFPTRIPVPIICLIAIPIILLLISPDTQAETYVNSDIDVDTTWIMGNGPYIVEEEVLVLEGATLEISPGTQVYFEWSIGITVEGRLIADGTRESNIVFRSNQIDPQNEDWDGLTFKSEGNRLNHCRISHAYTALHMS